MDWKSQSREIELTIEPGRLIVEANLSIRELEQSIAEEELKIYPTIRVEDLTSVHSV